MRLRVGLATALALLLAGCERQPPTEAGTGKDPVGPVTPVTLTGTTSDGLYRVSAAPDKGTIPLNEHVALDVTVAPGRGGALPEGLTLSVDADMPTHRHGINVRPAVTTAAGVGRFRVEGLLLHMPGDWELYLDVTAPAARTAEPSAPSVASPAPAGSVPPGAARPVGASRATFKLRLE